MLTRLKCVTGSPAGTVSKSPPDTEVGGGGSPEDCEAAASALDWWWEPDPREAAPASEFVSVCRGTVTMPPPGSAI